MTVAFVVMVLLVDVLVDWRMVDGFLFYVDTACDERVINFGVIN